jgi:UDP-2,3-diacylglucosamine pyrophosphatase LpxH
MDPTTLILTALVAGASALAKGSLSEAGKDLYKAIKSKIQLRLQGQPQGQAILAEYEKDPETWEKPFRKTLLQVGAEKDQELLSLAKQLLVQIHYQRGNHDVLIANSNVTNSTIVAGDFRVEQRGTHNVYIGKAGQVLLGDQNKPTQIREVKIDLQLQNGEYPKRFWLEEVESRNLFADGRRRVTREWWEPSNFNRDYLNKILLEEINALGSNGWELVETNLGDLWQMEHNVQETLASRLTNLVGMSIGHTWKNSITIFGARFHMRHSIG